MHEAEDATSFLELESKKKVIGMWLMTWKG